ncbi:hypothetical protein [Streptomyces sp. NPDC007205]|uniref:hypothetical protein n=1 Tax=Streptomyces sp. NPDC007205 TaxID=3154316 RepID=UPI0033D8D259
MVKRLAAVGSAAALLAGALTIGFGTTAAHADGCPTSTAPYRWVITECLNQSGGTGYTDQYLDGRSATTDVRFYDELWSNCGGGWHIVSSNDGSGGIHAWRGQELADHRQYYCPGASFESHAYETESGNVVWSTWVS